MPRSIRPARRLLLGAILALAPAIAGTVSAASWCLDVERDTVAPLSAGASCAGRIVDDNEADAARQRRMERVRRAVGGPGASPGAVPLPKDSSRAERRLASVGTGFFVTADGKLLTNNHVVERCAEITVDTAVARNQPARIVAAQPENDLALADTAAPPPAFARMRAGGSMPSGGDVALVGFPTQGLAPLAPLLTPGILSHIEPADARGPIRSPRLVFKADVRGGNSGGPLLDASGLVIGIVFAELNSAHYLRATGRTVIDVGFAIPVPTAAQFLARHGVALTGAAAGPVLDRAALHAEAARHVVRVNCLR